MNNMIQPDAIRSALLRVCTMLDAQSDYLTTLDQAIGDGDMGITMGKVATALRDYIESTAVETDVEDIGKWLAQAGMAVNRAAPSTMGTLIATALMRAGKEVRGQSELSLDNLAAMFAAADQGIQDRGKAKLGDKTIVDAIHPAAEAFKAALDAGSIGREAGMAALAAAEEGRDSVTPLRSKIGRAGWIGERTEGKLDPGCAMFAMVLGKIVEG